MNIFRKIKNNRLIRGIFYTWRQIFGFGRSSFGHLSDGSYFTPPNSLINPKNIFIYGNVCIGNACISALNAKFIVKEGCTLATGLNVQTGNHARCIGTFVGDITEANKPEGYDQDVVVEEDVWIGSNVTLLSGVMIGRGTTVAAGAVVSKSMPPYCVCGGIPARFIKFYWTIDQILEHEKKLYSEEKRYTKETLEQLFLKYQK